MTIVGVLGAKGGCGASLVATNLAVVLAQHGTALLFDLHPRIGHDDLLLDLRPQRSWGELLRVADELKERHVQLVAVEHASGMKLLGAPQESLSAEQAARVSRLLRGLEPHSHWLVVDFPSGAVGGPWLGLEATHILLLVCTPDLPALRSAGRLLVGFSDAQRERVHLVINQYGRGHPARPGTVAQSLGVPLLATLPADSRAVGYQVSFGMPCVSDPRSRFGRAIVQMAGELLRIRMASMEAPADMASRLTMEIKRR